MEQKPPYGSVKWYREILGIVRKKKPKTIDKEFLRINQIAPGNETKVLLGLKFLGIIDEEGNPTELMDSLRTLNEDKFREALRNIINKAYADLFDKLILERASFMDLVTYFMQVHGMSETVAKQAAHCFIFFCQESGIHLPENLTVKAKEKIPQPAKGAPRKRKTRVEKHEVEVLSWGLIRIELPKGDLRAAERAKEMLELYIKDLKARGGS